MFALLVHQDVMRKFPDQLFFENKIALISRGELVNFNTSIFKLFLCAQITMEILYFLSSW